MKNVVFVLLLAFLYFPFIIFAQKNPDTDTWQLKGKVRRLESYLTDFANNNGKFVRRPHTVTVFDTNGNIIELVHYNDGEISLKSIFFFDDKGRRAGFTESVSNPDKTMSAPTKVVFTLDDAGKTIEARRYERDGELSYDTFYKYDADGNLIERSEAKSGKSILTYDRSGNQTSSIFYDTNGVVQGKQTSVFDNRNRRIESASYESETLRYKIRRKYDSKNRITQIETEEFNGKPDIIISDAPRAGKVIYIYNDEKRMTETAEYDAGGTLKKKSVSFFDERGNTIAFDCETADVQSCKMLVEYEYDSNGNWTKKTALSRKNIGDAPRAYHIHEHAITYY